MKLKKLYKYIKNQNKIKKKKTGKKCQESIYSFFLNVNFFMNKYSYKENKKNKTIDKNVIRM